MPARWNGAVVLAAALLAVGGPASGQEDGFDLGGAVRFNHAWRDFGALKGDHEFDLELLRVDARGQRGPWHFSLQYRWYEDFDAVHHAWFGYRLDDENDLRVGIQQVPFGLLPYASHGFWFGSGYYLGIEDDYDLGVVWRHDRGDANWQLGLFAGDEYGDGARFGRYSFDVATTPALPYRERARLHGRYERRFAWGDDWRARLGASAFGGRVENQISGRRENHRGAALHAEIARGPWSLQLQWARYDYDVPGRRIALSAFDFPFEIASGADVLTTNLAYAFGERGWFDVITCYSDFSTTRASGPGLADSWLNVTGCSFARGAMFTYVDWVTGRNMWFVGGPGVGIAEPGGDRTRARLNINIGFYF